MSGTASALVAPGAIVAGKYRLDAVIGEGGMGAVWAATHTGLGQAVAIKFISKEFITSSEALRRFDSEAKAAAQLRSRHVVQVFDNGTLEDGTPYIAMELLRGENVHGRVHRAGPVPLNESIEILSQCCKALSRAHAAGIVHRDIKPDNIFLTQTDEEGILVKVLDFGIAKFASSPSDHSSTRTGAVLGTPLYMSPEQARGLKTIDYRTDIYSLGLVAYTMLTGNLAFSSESFGDLLVQICTAPLPSLCANAPWLPAAMELWFQRACARDPASRFASAQELADALRAAAGASRASALPESAVQPMPAGGLAGNVANAVSIGTASGMSRTRRSVRPARRAEEPRSARGGVRDARARCDRAGHGVDLREEGASTRGRQHRGGPSAALAAPRPRIRDGSRSSHSGGGAPASAAGISSQCRCRRGRFRRHAAAPRPRGVCPRDLASGRQSARSSGVHSSADCRAEAHRPRLLIMFEGSRSSPRAPHPGAPGAPHPRSSPSGRRHTRVRGDRRSRRPPLELPIRDGPPLELPIREAASG